MIGSTTNANDIQHINTEDIGTVPEKMLSGDFGRQGADGYSCSPCTVNLFVIIISSGLGATHKQKLGEARVLCLICHFRSIGWRMGIMWS